MNHFILGLVLAGLLIGDPLSLSGFCKNLWAASTSRFSIQVASCLTLTATQKEIDRLNKTFNLEAKYTTRVDRFNKKWFVVYINNFKTKEKATRYGKELINKGVIKNYRIFPQEGKEEVPAKAKESPASASIPSIKESKPLPKISPVYFGPIVIKEEETSLRINIFMDQKIFPEIMSDKIPDGSRLIVTFKNIGKYIVPVEFDKVQSKALLSFSVANKGPDCIFILLLTASYNYEVSQNYYEKEKIYSLFIGRVAAAEPNRIIKE